ncbi:hypothetical protein QUF80_22620, partial [Desulfococcaceae bacterium HSG8]|nr:hypothetical protein [Desulfococcaceae bacterium HSG8]
RAAQGRLIQSSLRDSGRCSCLLPGNELPGYFQMSLRDKKYHPKIRYNQDIFIMPGQRIRKIWRK